MEYRNRFFSTEKLLGGGQLTPSCKVHTPTPCEYELYGATLTISSVFLSHGNRYLRTSRCCNDPMDC
eukprot:2444308-Amphidinium_carterae.1